jgi:hypothetical protein
MQEGSLQRLRIRVGAVSRTVARRGGGRSVRVCVGRRRAGVIMHEFRRVRRRGGGKGGSGARWHVAATAAEVGLRARVLWVACED